MIMCAVKFDRNRDCGCEWFVTGSCLIERKSGQPLINVVVLMVVGVLLWLVNTYIPIDAPPLGLWRIETMAGMKNILIGALIAGVAVLGYLYYQNRQSTIEIKLPNVSIEKK
jgi:hypothetical protein